MSGLGESIYNKGKNEGISIGEARAAAQYQAQIAELKAQLAQLSLRK